jgi:hypothetical protein
VKLRAAPSGCIASRLRHPSFTLVVRIHPRSAEYMRERTKQIPISSLWGSFVLPCRRFFPDLRSTTHTSSLRASAAAHSEGSPSGLTKHAQATRCLENDGSTLANLLAGDTQRVSLKSPVGKTAVRNEPRGRRNRRHDLMAICHNARKGRYRGSHWSKPVAPSLYSTIFSYQ